MKKFSQITKGKVRRVNEADESTDMPAANLPQDLENQEEETTKQEILDDPAKEEGGNISKFFSKLFESREMAHIYHLQVKDEGSYAGHMALNDYYEGVLDFIDTLIETYQGQYGLVEEYDVIDTKETSSKDKIQYFEELASFIKVERKIISAEDSHLHNIVDEIVALLYKTLYKLKNLK